MLILGVEIAFRSRDNKTQILEFLRDAWAKDRRAEWSIWMVYSKVEMPHHYINGGFDESSHHIVHKRGSSLWKLTDDVNTRFCFHCANMLLLADIFSYEQQ